MMRTRRSLRSSLVALVALAICGALAACSASTATKGATKATTSKSTTGAGATTAGGASGADPLEGDGGPAQPVTADAAAATPAAVTYALPAVGTPVDHLEPVVPAPSPALVADHHRDPRRLRLLVITADDTDANYLAVRAALGRLGTPADVLVTHTHALSESMLWDGQHTANYSGVIIASSELVYQDPTTKQWSGTFSGSEVSLLWAFEAAFGIRQVSGNTFPDGPTGSYGLDMDGFVDVGAAGLDTTLTADGRKVFGYLNPDVKVPIRFARVYQAKAVDAAATTPLVVTPDGHLVASVTRFKDGRENLAVTTSVSADVLHWLLLSPGLVSWVSNGAFVGELHANLDVQIDDLFLIGVEWDLKTKSAKGPLAYRMTAADLDALRTWQTAKQKQTQLAQVRLEWAYNGIGTTQPEGAALTAHVKTQQADWNFVNHTWAHRDLDKLTHDEVVAAIKPNIDLASTLGFTNFSADSMVQPNISGLGNAEFFRAADELGIRYVISDTSRPEWNNPSPNSGIYSKLAPKILIVPRHTTSLYSNVASKEEWVSEFNFHYGPGGDQPVFDHDLTYAEILARDSDLMVKALITGDLDPWMFHQPNVRADAGQSVLADLLDATFTKYLSYYSLPVRNLRLQEVGKAMAARMAFDAAGTVAVLTPCTSISLTVTNAATVPLTGVAAAGQSEHYGNVDIAHVPVTPGQPVSVPVPACS